MLGKVDVGTIGFIEDVTDAESAEQEFSLLEENDKNNIV